MRVLGARPDRVAVAAVVAVVAAASLLVPIGASAVVNETSAERFGGRDRYETSVAVARAYLSEIADNPDRSETSAAIVVSGEDRHAGFAMPAAGLASAFDAPILLTPANELHDAVGEFVAERGFELVLIVGGAGVVSAAVERELAQGARSVRRIGSDNVFATSVAVAAEVGPIPGSAGEWGSRGRTALLANGVTVSDALVAGPLSYQGEHPLLLTPPGVLDGRVSAYLDRSDVEHVVIFGGTAAVSSAVEATVRAKGITTSRLSGPDRYGTAAVVARQLLGSGRPDRCFDGSAIGLAVGERAPDAVSSGPLLGERCAPLLLTRSRAVPAELDEVLTGSDLLGGTAKRLEVVVFGGDAAVADSTVSAVRNRALRGEPFTAEVSAVGGSKVFTVTFNEDVKEDEAIKADRYMVNNQPLVPVEDDEDAPESAIRYTEISLNGRTVTVELVEPLAVGITITVIGETGTDEGRSEIAVDDTLPALESVFYRVPRPPVVTDSTGPQIQIVAVAGEPEFVVAVTERSLRQGDRLRNDVMYRGEEVHELTVVDADGEPKTVTFVPSGGTDGSCPLKPEDPDPRVGLDQAQANKIGEQCFEDAATLGANLRYTATVGPEKELEPGDVITVAKGALQDRRRNPNKLTRYTVREHADNADNGDFRVERAAVGNPRHTKQASLLIRNTPESTSRRVRIDARSNGVAAGAAGNGWVIYPYVDPDRTEPADSVIEVGVDPVHRIISYTFVDGKITLANLSAALNADTTFRRHFSARVVSRGTLRCADAVVDPMDIGEAAGQRLCGGFSVVGLRVQFTDHVRSVTDAAPYEAVPPPPRSYGAPASFANRFLDGGDAASFAIRFLDDGNAAPYGVTVRCLRRGPVVYLEYVAIDDALVPRAGTPVRIPAGVATAYGDSGSPGVQNLRQRVFNLRWNPSIPAQFGYEQEQLDARDASELHCSGSPS